MKNVSSILLMITSVLCLFGGWQVLGKMNAGSQPNSILIPILAIFGGLTLMSGFRGYMTARSVKQMMPLVTSLSLVMGALAILMALFFLLP